MYKKTCNDCSQKNYRSQQFSNINEKIKSALSATARCSQTSEEIDDHKTWNNLNLCENKPRDLFYATEMINKKLLSWTYGRARGHVKLEVVSLIFSISLFYIWLIMHLHDCSKLSLKSWSLAKLMVIHNSFIF